MKIVFIILLLFGAFLFLTSQSQIAAREFELKTMTFNVRVDTPLDMFNSWSWRKHRVVAAIKDYQPDIIGIQEAKKHQVDYLHAYLAGYDWIGVGREGGTKENIVLSFIAVIKLLCLILALFGSRISRKLPARKVGGISGPGYVLGENFKTEQPAIVYTSITHI